MLSFSSELNVNFRQSSGDFKATAWSLDRPDWTGKLKVVTRGGDCCIRLFDKGSNKLHAECPVPAYPGPAVQGRNSMDNLNFGPITGRKNGTNSVTTSALHVSKLQ